MVTGYSDPSTATTLVRPRWLPAANMRLADGVEHARRPPTISSSRPRHRRPAPTTHTARANGTEAPAGHDQRPERALAVGRLGEEGEEAAEAERGDHRQARPRARGRPGRARHQRGAGEGDAAIPASTTAAGVPPAARSTATGTSAPSALIGAITLMLPTDSAR